MLNYKKKTIIDTDNILKNQKDKPQLKLSDISKVEREVDADATTPADDNVNEHKSKNKSQNKSQYNIKSSSEHILNMNKHPSVLDSLTQNVSKPTMPSKIPYTAIGVLSASAKPQFNQSGIINPHPGLTVGLGNHVPYTNDFVSEKFQ